MRRTRLTFHWTLTNRHRSVRAIWNWRAPNRGVLIPAAEHAAGEMNKIECEQLDAFFASNCLSRSRCSRASGEQWFGRARSISTPSGWENHNLMARVGFSQKYTECQLQCFIFQRHPCPAHHVPKNSLSERKTQVFGVSGASRPIENIKDFFPLEKSRISSHTKY